MSIALFMKNNDDCRLTHDNRWMFWQSDRWSWIVMEQKYRQRPKVVIETDDLALALRALGEQE